MARKINETVTKRSEDFGDLAGKLIIYEGEHASIDLSQTGKNVVIGVAKHRHVEVKKNVFKWRKTGALLEFWTIQPDEAVPSGVEELRTAEEWSH